MADDPVQKEYAPFFRKLFAQWDTKQMPSGEWSVSISAKHVGTLWKLMTDARGGECVERARRTFAPPFLDGLPVSYLQEYLRGREQEQNTDDKPTSGKRTA